MKSDSDSSFCDKLLTEINQARTSPLEYSSTIRAAKKKFNGKRYQSANGIIDTKEGFSAFEGAAHFLDGLDSIGKLERSKLLDKAASDCLDYIMNNLTNYEEEKLDDLVLKNGEPHGEYANQIDIGSINESDIVMGLLADDGNTEKSNRDIMLNPEFKFCGISSKIKDGSRITFMLYAILFKSIIN